MRYSLSRISGSRRRRGFTMVELIVVLSILAILAAIAVTSIVGYINSSRFDQNEQNAITIYQTAQTALSQKEANGTLDQWVQNVVSINDVFSEGEVESLSSVNESVHKLAELTYNPDAFNSTTIDNSSDTLLFDLLNGYFYDKAIFYGTISLELDISATYGNGRVNYSARVVSAFYCLQNDSETGGWDDIRIGNGYSEDFPNLPYAKGDEGYIYRSRTSYVGWFNGTEASVRGPVNVGPVFLPRVEVTSLDGHILAESTRSDHLFNLRNGETLDVSWALFDEDGLAHEDHGENLTITLLSAETTNSTYGNYIDDQDYYPETQLIITADALDEFLASVSNTNYPVTTTYERVNNIYDITRTSREGLISVTVIRRERQNDGSYEAKTYEGWQFPLVVTKVEGDGRSGCPVDPGTGQAAPYYEYSLSLDCMMQRYYEYESDFYNSNNYRSYGIGRLTGVNRFKSYDITNDWINPRNIYATLSGTWSYYDGTYSVTNGECTPNTIGNSILVDDPTIAARAIDDPVYYTGVQSINNVTRYCYIIPKLSDGSEETVAFYDGDTRVETDGKTITGRCVVNTLFGDYVFSRSTDLEYGVNIAGTTWSSSGGATVITSFRHLYNLRRINPSLSATFRIVRDLDWYHNESGLAPTSEVRVYASYEDNQDYRYKSPVVNGDSQIYVVSFPAINCLSENFTLTSMSNSGAGGTIYSINNIQMRAASFEDGVDAGYGLICNNKGQIYNIYTNNLTLILDNVNDGTLSDYCGDNNQIDPGNSIKIENTGTQVLATAANNRVGGLVGLNQGLIGASGLSADTNTVCMTNCLVLGGQYWEMADYCAGGIIGRNEGRTISVNNQNVLASTYGVLEVRGRFAVIGGSECVGGIIGYNSADIDAKLIVDGNLVNDLRPEFTLPVEVFSNARLSCVVAGTGDVGGAIGYNGAYSFRYGRAYDSSRISVDRTTGRISFGGSASIDYQIDVTLPADSLVIKLSSGYDRSVGGAIGSWVKGNGDFCNIRVNTSGYIVTTDFTNVGVNAGGAIGCEGTAAVDDSSSSSVSKLYISVIIGDTARIGSLVDTDDQTHPIEELRKVAAVCSGGAIGYIRCTTEGRLMCIDIVNNGSIVSRGAGNRNGSGGAIGGTSDKVKIIFKINVVNNALSRIIGTGDDVGKFNGVGGAIGGMGPSTSKLPEGTVIFVENYGEIVGKHHVGGVIGNAPEVSGKLYAVNHSTIDGQYYVGGVVGRLTYSLNSVAYIQSILDGATITGTNFVGGAAGRIGSLQDNAKVKTIVRSDSTVKGNTTTEGNGSVVGGVVGDLNVAGTGVGGEITLEGYSSTPVLTVKGLDGVGGAVGVVRANLVNSVKITEPDQSATNKLIIKVDGRQYVGGVAGSLRATSCSADTNTPNEVLTTSSSVAKDMQVSISIVLHPQSHVCGTSSDVGGAVGLIESSQARFMGSITVTTIQGDSTGAAYIKGLNNVGGAVGRDILSCPYLAEGTTNSDVGITVDLSASPWIISSTLEDVSQDANVGGAVGYFSNVGLSATDSDHTTTYLTNIRYYSKVGYNTYKINNSNKNNVFLIKVILGSSSVTANARNVGGAVGKSMLILGKIDITLSGNVSGRVNVGGAIGINRADIGEIVVNILGQGTITGGTPDDVNHDDLASPTDYDGSNVGGAVGYNISKMRIGITVDISGAVIGYGRNVGGAIGFCHYPEGKGFIQTITVTLHGNSRVHGYSSNVGGSVGYSVGNINKVTTNITGTSKVIGYTRVGGVIGFASAAMKNNTELYEGMTGKDVKSNKCGYIEEAIAIISADEAIEGERLIGGVIGESGFKRFIPNPSGGSYNAYTAPYFGKVRAEINSSSVFSPSTGPDSTTEDAMVGGVIGHLCDGMVDNVVLGGTGGVVHLDYPNTTYSNSVLIRANGRAVGGIVGQIGLDTIEQNVFMSQVTIEPNAPYLCVVSGNGSDRIGGWIGSSNGIGGGIGKRNNVPGYQDTNRSSYTVNNVRVVYSEGSFVGGFCGYMDQKCIKQDGKVGTRYINADLTVNLVEASIVGRSHVGGAIGGLGYGVWNNGSITVNMNNHTNIGDLGNNVSGQPTTNYTPICYEAGGAIGYVYHDTTYYNTNSVVTFNIPITVRIDSTSRVSGLLADVSNIDENTGVGGAFGCIRGRFGTSGRVTVETDTTVVSVVSQNLNVGGVAGVWVDGKNGNDNEGSDNIIYFVTNASVEARGDGACAGGFAGKILGTGNKYIQYARADGRVIVTGNNSYAGGFVGRFVSGTLNKCFTTSTVTNVNGECTGGFVGLADAGTIQHCYVGGHTVQGQYASGEGNITGASNVGGFVGKTAGNVTIDDCYTTASVLGTGSNIGGFIGNMSVNNGSIKGKSYCTGRVIGPEGSLTVGVFGGFVYNVGKLSGDNRAFESINDASLPLIGSDNSGSNVSPTVSQVAQTSSSSINNSGTYDAYPSDSALRSDPNVDKTTFAFRAVINNTHYGDWPLPISGNISILGAEISWVEGVQFNPEDGIPEFAYNPDGVELENYIIVRLPDRDEPLVCGRDYTLTYPNECNKRAGEATVIISAKAGTDYKGSITVAFRILPLNLSSINLEITMDQGPYPYTGAPITPDISIQIDDEHNLVQNTDYILIYNHEDYGYGNHTNLGKITVIVRGIGNYYGTANWSEADQDWFTIVGSSLVDADVTLTNASAAELVYTGEEITPGVTVRIGGRTLDEAERDADGNYIIDENGNFIGDYIVQYINNIEAGTETASVQVTGVNSYTGSKTKVFSISPAANHWTTNPNIEGWIYGGEPNEPVAESEYGTVVIEFYSDQSCNTLVDPDNPSVLPVDVGDYWMKVSVLRELNPNSAYNYSNLTPRVVAFTIERADISNPEEVVTDVSIDSNVEEYIPGTTNPQEYRWTGDEIKPAVSIGNDNLIEGDDYVITYSGDGTNPGLVTITIEGQGNYIGTITRTYNVVRFYAVTFNTGEEETTFTVEVRSGSRVSEPSDPSRAHYRFAWWAVDEALTQRYSFSSYVTGDITLYAKWVPTVTVRFIIDINDQTTWITDVIDAGTAPLVNDPERTGYTFEGWYTDSSYTDRVDTSEGFPRVHIDSDYYAKWEPIMMTVTFDSSDEDYEGSRTDCQVAYGTPVNSIVPETREGYELLGWYTDPERTNAYDFSMGVTDNIILYAKWDLVVEDSTSGE